MMLLEWVVCALLLGMGLGYAWGRRDREVARERVNARRDRA